MPINKKSLRIQVYGNVQGVTFRASAREKAIQLNLVGFVQNEPDGSVIAEVHGGEGAVDKFITWCKSGPSSADVERVEVREVEPKSFNDFSIRY